MNAETARRHVGSNERIARQRTQHPGHRQVIPLGEPLRDRLTEQLRPGEKEFERNRVGRQERAQAQHIRCRRRRALHCLEVGPPGDGDRVVRD